MNDNKKVTRRTASRMLLAAPFGLALAPLVGCGGKEEESGGGGGGGGGGEAKSFTIEVGDAINYSLKELRCSAGDQVTVTLNHTGSMAKEAMGHNFVLLKAGVDMNLFATAAVAAVDSGYIPANRAGDVIAHTKLIGGGESDSVTFTAPAAGTYTYLCTFPGHYSVMNGQLIVS